MVRGARWRTRAHFLYAVGTKLQVAVSYSWSFLHSCDKEELFCRMSARKMVEIAYKPQFGKKLIELVLHTCDRMPRYLSHVCGLGLAGGPLEARRCRKRHGYTPRAAGKVASLHSTTRAMVLRCDSESDAVVEFGWI